MKVVRFHKTGSPDVLVYEEVPTPSPKKGEVLIKIEAVGLNYADVMRRRGDDYPDPSPVPFILGAEIAGTIETLGEGVTSFEIGTAVLVTPGDGGYAQYICVPAAIVIPLPNGITTIQAAAIVGHGLTAALVIREAAKFLPGETILIEAAAGGVGSFAVQLAKLYGASKVIAAASTPEKRAIAESFGADISIDYTKSDWAEKVLEATEGRGVDVVIETIGGETLNQALTTMASNGRMIFLGQSSGKTALIDPWRLTVPNHTIKGFYIGAYMSNYELIQSTLNEIIGFILSEKLKINVGTVLPLSQATEAHRLLENRMTTGKVVLLPWAN